MSCAAPPWLCCCVITWSRQRYCWLAHAVCAAAVTSCSSLRGPAGPQPEGVASKPQASVQEQEAGSPSSLRTSSSARRHAGNALSTPLATPRVSAARLPPPSPAGPETPVQGAFQKLLSRLSPRSSDLSERRSSQPLLQRFLSPRRFRVSIFAVHLRWLTTVGCGC